MCSAVCLEPFLGGACLAPGKDWSVVESAFRGTLCPGRAGLSEISMASLAGNGVRVASGSRVKSMVVPLAAGLRLGFLSIPPIRRPRTLPRLTWFAVLPVDGSGTTVVGGLYGLVVGYLGWAAARAAQLVAGLTALITGARVPLSIRSPR